MLHFVYMSNIKHSKCPMRDLAGQAKSRLINNDYARPYPPVPKNATPQQREIYLKLYELKQNGKTVDNPVTALADPQKLKELSHEEKQRYIIQLCSDYISMRSALTDFVRME